jgi:hypothetical protein
MRAFLARFILVREIYASIISVIIAKVASEPQLVVL